MVTIVSKLYRNISMRDLRDFERPSDGDQIFVKLKNDEDVVFDVTRDATGKQFIITNDCLRDRYMLGYEDNDHGWSGMSFRTILNSDIYGLLPDELQEIIVPTKIVQVVRGRRFECEDKLFCLSATQVFGNDPEYRHQRNDGRAEYLQFDDEVAWSAQEPEDSPLEIFKHKKERIKCRGIGGAVSNWWLRSPLTGGTTAFAYVTTSGAFNASNAASSSSGVCFGFCI